MIHRYLSTFVLTSCLAAYLCASSIAYAGEQNKEITPALSGLLPKSANDHSYRRILLQQLRQNLVRDCSEKHTRPVAMADRHNRISLSSREARIIAIDLHIQRLNSYRQIIHQSYIQNQYEIKLMRIGYLLSDTLLKLGSWGLSKTLDVPWLHIIIPSAVKLTNKLLTAENHPLPRPLALQLDIHSDINRLLQFMQFGLHPGSFSSLACYLSSPSLRDHSDQLCHPDHPVIRQRHQQLGQMWQRSRQILKQQDLPSFWNVALEFITRHRANQLKNQRYFLLATNSLLEVQTQFLQQIRAILINDYRAWGCPQISRPHL